MATAEPKPSTSDTPSFAQSLFSDEGHARHRGIWLPTLGVLVSLAVWYGITHYSGGLVTRFAPGAALSALRDLLLDPGFYGHIGTSLYRVFMALLFCVVIGIPIGLLVGYFKAVEQATSLVFQFLRMISPLAWFPIAIIILGVGSKSAIFVMVMAGVWPVILNTAHGVVTIEQEWLRVGRSLGGKTPGLLRKIVLPAVFPDILSGLRLCVGIIWIILVPAEMLGVNSGLGYYILDARDRFAYAEIPAVILVIGFVGFWLDLVIRSLHQRWNWQQAR